MKLARSLVFAVLSALAAAGLGCGGDGGGQACSVNADCAGKGTQPVCRADTRQCVDLASDLCTVHGDATRDDAFVFGSIGPLSGADASFGEPIKDAILLAIDDFAQAGGLPPRPGASSARPLVLVACDDQGDAEVGTRAAQHLAHDVGVPAIVGAMFSGITIQIATQVTIPAGVLLLSPSATSPNITNLDDHGLVWRTSPPDTLQAAALALYVPTIEQRVRTSLGLAATDQVRLAILNKGDAYGSDLAIALEKSLVLNGAAVTSGQNAQSYKRIDYGNPDDPAADPPKFALAVSTALGFQPHIVLVAGTGEGVNDVFIPIEQGWPAAAAYRPEYMFTDGGEVPDLWSFVAMNDPMDTLRPRVHGSVPGTVGPLAVAFRAAFLAKFTEGSSPDVFGAAGAYDATYLLGYGVAALGGAGITGAALAGGFGKLVPPGKVLDVGPANIAAAFQSLAQGGIDFNGASGPLDFDLLTGEAPSDIQIWCLPKDAMTGAASSPVLSGFTYDARTGGLGGADSGVCN
jgi:branched-chain amino acid transport system substrate-binding protein